jgi:transposase InsO family protein
MWACQRSIPFVLHVISHSGGGAATRRIVWLAMAEQMETTLIQMALQQALKQRRPARGCLHHSDRGSQYASAEHRQLMTLNSLEASMSRAGNCYDNAAMESF